MPNILPLSSHATLVAISALLLGMFVQYMTFTVAAGCLNDHSHCAHAGLHRQCLFGGLRIGLYEPVKNLYMGDRPPGDAPLYLKIAAGLTTGALAIAIASPTDLVKVGLGDAL